MKLRALLAAAALFAAQPAWAGPLFAVVNQNEHSDIAFFFENGSLELGVAFEDRVPPEEYAAHDVLHYLAPGVGRVTLPGSGFEFLAPGGSTVFVYPQVENQSLPFIGIGAEELDPADFPGGVRLTVEGVRGPGDFALWQSDPFGGTNLFFSTRGGGPGFVDIPVGGHDHYNFGFSAPGLYAVDLLGTGTLADGTAVSARGTFFFGVEATAAPVPAPPAAALWAGLVGVAGLARAVRRRRA